MLVLHRIIHPTEFLKCQISGEIIRPGDFYYEDDEDGLIVKATIYRQIKDEYERNNFDYSKLQAYQSEMEYAQALKEATRRKKYESLLSRKVTGKGN